MRQFRNLVLLPILLSTLTLYGGYTYGRRGYEVHLSKNPVRVEFDYQESRKRDVDLSLFFEVWDLLHQDYLRRGGIHDEDMVYGAISGLTQSVGDPYTAFLTPEENDAVKDGINGEYEGIGAELGLRDDWLVVIAPLEGSPAEQAGVKAGDKIVKIDGEETRNTTLSEAVSRIRGEAGTVITLTLGRGLEDTVFDADITRGRITLESVAWKDKGDGVFYMRVSRFGEKTVSEWQEAVRGILQQGPVLGLVVDLRNNPGGLLSAAIEMASDFIDQGVIVVEEFADGSQQSFGSTHLGKLNSIPTVILLNEGSASASEILAAALKHHCQAQIVGEQSFGKGTVQDARDLPDGSGVHITVAKWLTPGGEWVDEKGIAPDVEVELTDEDIEADRDSQLDAAVRIFSGL